MRVRLNLHFDLVRGISAHHVLNRQLASGMPLEPFVQAQDLVVEDDDGLVVCNEPFDLAARENAGAAHLGGGLGGKEQTHGASERRKSAPGDWARVEGREQEQQTLDATVYKKVKGRVR